MSETLLCWLAPDEVATLRMLAPSPTHGLSKIVERAATWSVDEAARDPEGTADALADRSAYSPPHVTPRESAVRIEVVRTEAATTALSSVIEVVHEIDGAILRESDATRACVRLWLDRHDQTERIKEVETLAATA